MDRYRVIEKFANQNNWAHGLELVVWVGVTTFCLMNNTTMHMTSRAHSRELINQSIAARSKPLKEVGVGQRVLFYRSPRNDTDRAGIREYVGPGYVFGLQDTDVWT